MYLYVCVTYRTTVFLYVWGPLCTYMYGDHCVPICMCDLLDHCVPICMCDLLDHLCSSLSDHTAVSLSDNIYQYAMEMQCTIFGTDVLIWKINGLEVQQFFVGGGMTNANTTNCSFNVVWRNVSDRSIQSLMTCWSPDGWAGMNVTCQSDNIASCSLVKSAAISPTTRDPSTGNFPPSE